MYHFQVVSIPSGNPERDAQTKSRSSLEAEGGGDNMVHIRIPQSLGTWLARKIQDGKKFKRSCCLFTSLSDWFIT